MCLQDNEMNIKNKITLISPSVPIAAMHGCIYKCFSHSLSWVMLRILYNFSHSCASRTIFCTVCASEEQLKKKKQSQSTVHKKLTQPDPLCGRAQMLLFGNNWEITTMKKWQVAPRWVMNRWRLCQSVNASQVNKGSVWLQSTAGIKKQATRGGKKPECRQTWAAVMYWKTIGLKKIKKSVLL